MKLCVVNHMELKMLESEIQFCLMLEFARFKLTWESWFSICHYLNFCFSFLDSCLLTRLTVDNVLVFALTKIMMNKILDSWEISILAWLLKYKWQILNSWPNLSKFILLYTAVLKETPSDKECNWVPPALFIDHKFSHKFVCL